MRGRVIAAPASGRRSFGSLRSATAKVDRGTELLLWRQFAPTINIESPSTRLVDVARRPYDSGGATEGDTADLLRTALRGTGSSNAQMVDPTCHGENRVMPVPGPAVMVRPVRRRQSSRREAPVLSERGQ